MQCNRFLYHIYNFIKGANFGFLIVYNLRYVFIRIRMIMEKMCDNSYI